MKSRDRKPLFERPKKGLNEGIAHATGELTLRTVAIPDPPPEIDAETLASVRAQSAMSQRVFAKMLNVSPMTLQSWGARSSPAIGCVSTTAAGLL